MGFLRSLFTGKEQTAEEKAQATNEKNFDILKYDGIRARRMGQVDYAIRCFENALALQKETELILHLTEAYLVANRAADALQMLEGIHQEQPGNHEVLLPLIQVNDRLQQYGPMEQICQELLELQPGHALALFYYGKAKLAQKDPVNAIAWLTRAVTADPRQVSALMLRSRILESMHCYKEAEEDINTVLQLQPDWEDALLRRATLRYLQQDYDCAHDLFCKIKENNPMCREAYLGLSRIHSKKQQWQQALAIMDEALECIPEFGEGYKERGRVKMLSGDKEGAAADLKKALEYDPTMMQQFEGEITNIEEKMNRQYKQQNPYGF